MGVVHGNHYEEVVLKAYVDRFKDASVLVIGDVMLDEYLWGHVSRISPEAPVPVVEVRQETRMLGGAANVIRNMRTLGASPILCGAIGEDEAGNRIREELEALGLRTDGLIRERERPTSIKTRVVAQNQQVVRFDRESRQRLTRQSIEGLLKIVADNLRELQAVVVSDYGKGVITGPLMEGLNDLVRDASRDTVVCVDPKTGNWDYYKGVTVITPNHHEAAACCGFEITDEKSLHLAGGQMLDRLQCQSVLITRGKDGMSLFKQDGDIIHIPTVARRVFDVTGAGDTVIATISLALAAGLDLKSAAILANFAAGIVVGEVGTSAVDAAELKRVIELA